VLAPVLLAELLDLGDELWLVTAWGSDVPAIDNTRGDYDSLFADASARTYALSEILALTCGRGLRAVGSGPDLGRWWCEGGLEHFDEEVRDHRCNDDQRRDRGSGARSQQQRDHHRR
jgi:hypothetical protein